MRIDVVCSSRELFGSDRSALRLVSLLRDIGHEPQLLVPESRPERGLTALAERHDIPVKPDGIAVVSRRGVSGINSAARKRPSDADLTIFNSIAVLPFRSRSVPSALVLREWLYPLSRRHRTLAAMYSRSVNQVVAVSNGVARQWRETATTSPPVDVIWNWLDESWHGPVKPLSGRAGIVFAGRLNSWKGQMMLADAYEQAFEKSADRPPLTFVGAEDTSSPFHTHVQPLEQRCRRAGWTLMRQRASLHETFKRAALLVVPSLRPEPFGNVILEALASGCRVIAFPGGGPDDLAPLFPAALDVVPRGTKPLADAMRRWWVTGAHAQSRQTQERTTETIRDMFSGEAVRARWSDLVERLAGMHSDLGTARQGSRVGRLSARRWPARTT